MLKTDLRHGPGNGSLTGARSQRDGETNANGQSYKVSTIYHRRMMTPDCDGFKTLCAKMKTKPSSRVRRTEQFVQIHRRERIVGFAEFAHHLRNAVVADDFGAGERL